MKKISYLLIAILFLAACSKSDNTSSTSTSDNGGSGSTTPKVTVAVWQLTGMSVDNMARELTTMQSTYRMSLFSDNHFSDTDGVLGTWSHPTADSLVIVQANLPTPITLRYKITASNSSTLTLSKTMSGKQTVLQYEAK